MPQDFLNKCLELASDVRKFFDRPNASDWRRLEEALGVVFPESHKRFVNAFGSGYFGPFEMWNPAGKGRFELSKQRLIETTQICVALEDMDLKVYPSKGGLVIIGDGTTSNFFALEPRGEMLQPELVEVDWGGHLVMPVNMGIAEYVYLSYAVGIGGHAPPKDCPYVPFFRPFSC